MSDQRLTESQKVLTEVSESEGIDKDSIIAEVFADIWQNPEAYILDEDACAPSQYNIPEHLRTKRKQVKEVIQNYRGTVLIHGAIKCPSFRQKVWNLFSWKSRLVVMKAPIPTVLNRKQVVVFKKLLVHLQEHSKQSNIRARVNKFRKVVKDRDENDF